MSLNAPNLDDRKFQDIVDDVKRQIGLRCPEWTDHNVSDPGVTLIELFAWMMEMMLFRLNQVPEKNYITFLEMLDITLEPPQPARTELLYELVQPIPDAPGPELSARLLALRQQTRSGMVAATRRTDTQEAIEFTTEADIEWTNAGLKYVLAVAAHKPLDEDKAVLDARVYPPPLESAFHIFNRPDLDANFKVAESNRRKPVKNDALYLGFTENVPRHVVALTVSGVGVTGVGMDPGNPLQRWEAYTGETANPWKPVKVMRDEIEGFDREGRIELALPADIVVHTFGGREAFWVRCRYIGSAEYSLSPAFTRLTAEVIGALAPAANYNILREEELGVSSGAPGQTFRLRYPPLLPLESLRGETLRVGAKPWELRANFAESGPEDCHFTCDFITGEARFGPSILQPDGSARQYGAIPAKGQKIAITSYRHGGGAGGNVREMQVCVDKDNLSYIADVTNPDVATGGRDLEHLERAKMRARAMLQMRHRAVTPEDFDFLTAQSSPQVGRAHCLRRETLPHVAKAVERMETETQEIEKKLNQEDTRANRLLRERMETLEARIRDLGEAQERGTVCVLVVPAFGVNILTPTLDTVIPEDFARIAQRAKEFLDTKRLLTTHVKVMAPDYVWVSIDIRVASDPHRSELQVAHRVKESLNRLVHPLCGGEQGEGWTFGRPLTVADVYARVSAVEGVAYLTPPVLKRYETETGAGKDVGSILELLPHQLLLSRAHKVTVVPLPFFGHPEESRHRVDV